MRQETDRKRGKAGMAAMFVMIQLYLSFSPVATWKEGTVVQLVCRTAVLHMVRIL